jgi:hypothetical protein
LCVSFLLLYVDVKLPNVNGIQQAGGVREWAYWEGIQVSEGGNYVMSSFMIFTHRQILFG